MEMKDPTHLCAPILSLFFSIAVLFYPILFSKTTFVRPMTLITPTSNCSGSQNQLAFPKIANMSSAQRTSRMASAATVEGAESVAVVEHVTVGRIVIPYSL